MYKYENLQLIKLNINYQNQLNELMEEWTKTNEKIVPWAIRRVDYQDFNKYLNSLESGFLPILESTYFLYDAKENKLIGGINIRHSLNEQLLKEGGHIGYGIRPTERNKGYATIMLKLALEEVKKLNIEKVLITCDKNNIASAKTILKCGGILENEIEVDGKIIKRYWISI